MAVPKPLSLFIPRKTQKPVDQPDYGTDMRAIEAWAKALVAYVDSLGTGGYASLTGPGELGTPGDLTQAGGFTINAPSASAGFVVSTASGSGGVAINDSSSTGITILGHGTGQVSLASLNSQVNIGSGSQPVVITSSSGEVDIDADSGRVAIQTTGAGNLSFFAATGSPQQSGAGVTTVANVVTVLRNYGLLS